MTTRRTRPWRVFACALSAVACGTAGAPATAPIAAASVGDLTLSPTAGGGVELAVAGRVLLRADRPPVFARTYDETVRSAFGQWTFARREVVTRQPATISRLAVEGDAVVLEARGADGTSALRVRRVSPDEVELRASAQGATAARELGVRFRCEAASHFLGFGEQFNAVDHRGAHVPLWVSEQGIGRDPDRRNAFSGDHTTTYFPVPFFLDPRGFGVALDTDARAEADLCRDDPAAWTFSAQEERELVVRLYTGPTVPDVMRAWTLLQGRTAAPPAWAVDGVWLGVQGGPAAVRAAVERARRFDVPTGAVWAQDWLGRRDFGAGNAGVRYRWSVDEARYPDLGGLIGELRSQGVRFLGYFNSFLAPEQDLYEPAVRLGYAVRRADGSPYTFVIAVFSGGLLDVNNPAAVTWFQGYADRALDLGMSGWMQDFGEWLPHDAVVADGSDARRAHNRYPERWQRAAREVLERRHPDGDWILLSRSGWLRTAQVSQVVWAGDQEATWDEHDGLQTVIPAMVSLGLAGVGYCTHDVAGFSGGPSTRELYQRWVELAAFTPVFRTHEGLRGPDNWGWDRDDDTTRHFARFARVHRALAPEIRALGEAHQRTGMPIVRALGLAFPGDVRGYDVRDEFMLGDALLVAPVVTQGATSRTVYLPPGEWFDVWDPAVRRMGPSEVTVEAPIGRPPVFSRAARTDLAALVATGG